ncbi:NACHT domain-containing protein [Streptomyces sp. P6-2-1]|uniref:NACHT domain-containing protein n=1 Tax=Streptomyces sp. P6-2-1 TaxID=3422591 RepID=UPI003D3610BF
MDDTDYPVPVVFFCRTLGSLVAACGLPHTALTGPLGRGDSAVSQLLNGRLRRPPQWETVARVLECCRAHRAGRPPLHHTFDPAFWRQLHHQMVTLTERERERPAPRRRRASAPAFRPVEAVPEDFAEAVDVLVGGRPGLEGIAEELLAPLRLGGAAPVGTEHLLRGFAARVRAHHGTTRTALLCAADRVILVTAFCEAVATSGLHHGLEPAATYADFDGDVVTELTRFPLGSTRVRAPADIREDVLRAYSSAADLVYGAVDPPYDKTADLVRRAWRRYEALLSDAVHECPELRLTSAPDDPPEALDPAPRPVPRGLSELAAKLDEFAGQTPPAHRLLREPLAVAEDAGPVPPSLRDGYLDPAYRLAGEGARPGDLARESWWRTRPPRDDLAGFLAAHFLTDDAGRAPLLVLGHPGAGKSLLTRLLTARLPPTEFTCLRVELRHAPAGGGLAAHLAAELQRTAPARSSATEALPRVLLLDGLDELLQALAGRPEPDEGRRLLAEVEEFQSAETLAGRPTLVVVTSRTLAAARMLSPRRGTVIHLEPFDDARIREWVAAWNARNRRWFAAREVQPLAAELLRSYGELACQPLLLLMLALYDASDNALRAAAGAGFGRLELYERLLTAFIRRQLAKQGGPLPEAEHVAAVEEEFLRLSVLALGMFRRHRRSLTAREAIADLGAYPGPETGTGAPGGSPGAPDAPTGAAPAPVPGGPLLFGRFFFVRAARPEGAGEEDQSYEFLHATFGEFLLARLLATELRALAGRGEDTRLRPLLAHVPLGDHPEVLAAVAELVRPADPAALAHHLGAHLRASLAGVPGRLQPPRRVATYTANLALLAVRLRPGITASALLGTADPVGRWRACARLWQACLTETSWAALSRHIHPAPHPRSPDLRLGGPPDAVPSPWELPARSRPEARPLRDQLADLARDARVRHEPALARALHALAPLAERLPALFETEGGQDPRHSAAHAVVSLLTDRPVPYEEIPPLLQPLPPEQLAPALDTFVRHFAAAAPALPPDTVTAVLSQLARGRFAQATTPAHRALLAATGNPLPPRPRPSEA